MWISPKDSKKKTGKIIKIFRPKSHLKIPGVQTVDFLSPSNHFFYVSNLGLKTVQAVNDGPFELAFDDGGPYGGPWKCQADVPTSPVFWLDP